MNVCFHEKTWGERENAFASARRVDAKSKSREPTGVDSHQYKVNRLSYTSSCLT
jgi:hypothetical protein